MRAETCCAPRPVLVPWRGVGDAPRFQHRLGGEELNVGSEQLVQDALALVQGHRPEAAALPVRTVVGQVRGHVLKHKIQAPL